MHNTAIICCHFNPAAYLSRRRNFEGFVQSLGPLADYLWVVEGRFPHTDFELPYTPRTLRITCTHVLWQKERLLNLLVQKLPEWITKIVWLDGDIHFQNPEWFESTSQLLDECNVVQPFESAVRLSRVQTEELLAIPLSALTLPGAETGKESYHSFAGIQWIAPRMSAIGTYAEHGHTGFAWAARRELFSRVGLYELALSGAADHLMAHVFSASFDSPCLRHLLGSSGAYRDHFMEWAARASAVTLDGRIGLVRGQLLHMWHGETAHRRYFLRSQQLVAMRFDPAQDVARKTGGALEWSSDRPALHDWADKCFRWRREDG